jgi:hypothetical protein
MLWVSLGKTSHFSLDRNWFPFPIEFLTKKSVFLCLVVKWLFNSLSQLEFSLHDDEKHSAHFSLMDNIYATSNFDFLTKTMEQLQG